MTGIWEISLFGGIRAKRGHEIVERFRSHNIGALLAYLCLYPRQHAREELADLFWPDAEPAVGRTNLRTAIASLRRQLEPPGDPSGSVLNASSQSYIGINSEAVQIDVRRFEAAIASLDDTVERLVRAADLYTGPLLPGFYETWAVTERTHLTESYLQVLGKLTRRYEQCGMFDKALDYAQRAISEDPLREESHADVIRLMMANGQAGAARKHYTDYSQLLEQELGLEPEPETRALLDARPGTPTRTSLSTECSDTAPITKTPKVQSSARQAPRLPLTMTRFFGREKDLTELTRLIQSGSRLVTLTGFGGCGKTRLSIEVARLLSETTLERVYFVPLADLRNSQTIPEAIADILELPRLPSVRPLDQVIETLGRSGPTLLVLDNFEQLVDGGAQIVQELLARAPDVSCLVSSRQCLSLDGEREYPLLPLPIPKSPGAPERLLEFPSVQLFVNRAQAARPDFQLSVRNAAAVALLCARLEGIPLAVELAAAWMHILTPSQVLDRLDRRFDVLVSRRRDLSDRHQTLRATVEWSYQLLPSETRHFFAQLSVFRGGWTLEAAEEITGNRQVLEHLTILREHSLVLAVESSRNSEMRYRMLETLREFATEQIQATNECAALYPRHYQYFLGFAESLLTDLYGPDQGAGLDKLEAERDNIRESLSWAIDFEPEAGLRLITVMFRYWGVRAHVREGSSWLEQALFVYTEATELRAEALYMTGSFAWYLQDWTRARSSLAESIAIYRRLGNPPGLAMALVQMSSLLLLNDNNPGGARTLWEEAWVIAERSGDIRAQAAILERCTTAAGIVHDWESGERSAQEWLRLARQIGDRVTEVAALFWRGLLITNSGDPARARPYLEEAIAISKLIGERFWGSGAWFALGLGTLLEGDLAKARELHRKSFELLADTGYQFTHHYILEGLAYIAAAEGDAQRAGRLIGLVAQMRRTAQTLTAPLLSEAFDPYAAMMRNALSDQEFEREQEIGAKMTLEEALEYGLRTKA